MEVWSQVLVVISCPDGGSALESSTDSGGVLEEEAVRAQYSQWRAAGRCLSMQQECTRSGSGAGAVPSGAKAAQHQ